MINSNMAIRNLIENKKQFHADIAERVKSLAAHLRRHHGLIASQGRLPYPWDPGIAGILNIDDALSIDPNAPRGGGTPYRNGDEQGFGFWFSDWFYIDIFNIRPLAGADTQVVYGPAEQIDSVTKVARTIDWENSTLDPIPQTPQFGTRDEDEDTTGTQLGTVISAGFETTIGGELYGGGAKFSASVSQSLNFNQQKRSLFATTFDSISDITLAPYTKTYMDELVEVGTKRMHVTATGPLDFSIRISSNQDYYIIWNSMGDAIQAMTGVAPDNGSNWGNFYRDFPIVDIQGVDGVKDPFDVIDGFFSPLTATVETDVEIEGAMHYSYRVRTENLPIPDGE